MDPIELLRLLALVPLVIVWALAVLDVVLRVDLRWWAKVLVAVAMLAVFPLTLVYLLARPPSEAGVPAAEAADWRYALMESLDGESVVEVTPATPLGELVDRVVGAVQVRRPLSRPE